jgi:5-hydroxyisourate hydrolase-like protein (transthyretin family)
MSNREYSLSNNNNKSVEEKALEYAASEKIRAMNSSFSTFKYYPEDKLSHIEEKFLHRLDLELAHRNPNIVMEVNNDKSGNYKMSFSNGEILIEKKCNDKEKCFTKLKDFMKSLSGIPISTK